MTRPIYHEFGNGAEAKLIVLGCETCGQPIIPQFRNEHTLWHKYIDRIAEAVDVVLFEV